MQAVVWLFSAMLPFFLSELSLLLIGGGVEGGGGRGAGGEKEGVEDREGEGGKGI